MSAPIAKSQLQFALPSLSYVDASWEEPNLRTAVRPAAKRGLGGWIVGRIAILRAWNRQRHEAAELRSMTDRELADIGLNRGDIGRAFTPAFGHDQFGH